jgi:hypothetical protein
MFILSSLTEESLISSVILLSLILFDSSFSFCFGSISFFINSFSSSLIISFSLFLFNLFSNSLILTFFSFLIIF